MAEALEPFQESFPPLYLGLIRIGELSGNMKTVLPQLKRYLQGKKKIREKSLSALLYPGLVIIVLILGMAALTVFILPTFLMVAESFGAADNGRLNSRLLIFQIAFITVFFSVFIVIGLVSLARSRSGSRLAIDRFILKTPPLNRLFVPMEMQNLCFAFAALLESGFPVETALVECSQVTGNHAIAVALDDARHMIKKGQRLSAAFRSTGLFPDTFCSWISVGEEAHSLRPAIERLRDHYTNEFEKLSNTIMNLIEPVLILLVGVVLLLVILQFIGPIYALLGGLS
jgi:type II secretory pathway component PulF